MSERTAASARPHTLPAGSPPTARQPSTPGCAQTNGYGANRRIVVEWSGYSGPTTVEWIFAPQKDATTFVRVTESGFTGTGDQLVKYVADSTQGFTLMLAGLKALLEHVVRLNLVGDRYPKGMDEQQRTKG